MYSSPLPLPAVWLTTQQLHSSVPFLPVNPSLSPMRNQARQKLATLDAKEFTHLVIDILLDANRRQNISLETGMVYISMCTLFTIISLFSHLSSFPSLYFLVLLPSFPFFLSPCLFAFLTRPAIRYSGPHRGWHDA